MKKIFLILSFLSSFVILAEAKNGGTTDGAFTTLMLSATDVDRYVETLRSNSSAFKATGATDAGVCITRSGNEYDGQMLVWSAFSSVQAALEGSLKYDPQKASPSFARLRDAKYGVTWKPLKPFRLDPGYERSQRVIVPSDKLQDFVEALTTLEAAIIDAGHKEFFNGVFAPIGGGSHETQTLMVRSITPDATLMGKLFDEYFAGNASWQDEWLNLQAIGGVITTDTFEVCEQTYFTN
tara:strand:- start:12 stop:725 length:714 start_codon:yes stop_codon:yes gene_type:complete